jgi:hypothetical protein
MESTENRPESIASGLFLTPEGSLVCDGPMGWIRAKSCIKTEKYPDSQMIIP